MGRVWLKAEQWCPLWLLSQEDWLIIGKKEYWIGFIERTIGTGGFLALQQWEQIARYREEQQLTMSEYLAPECDLHQVSDRMCTSTTARHVVQPHIIKKKWVRGVGGSDSIVVWHLLCKDNQGSRVGNDPAHSQKLWLCSSPSIYGAHYRFRD